MLALLILFLPLLSVITVAVAGRRLGTVGSILVTTINIFLALTFSILFLVQSIDFTLEIDL